MIHNKRRRFYSTVELQRTFEHETNWSTVCEQFTQSRLWCKNSVRSFVLLLMPVFGAWYFFLLLLLYFIRVSCLSRSWCCMLIEFHAHWTLDFRTIELCPMNLLIKYRSNFFFYLKISNVFNGHKHDFIEFHEMSFTFCQIDRLTSTTELWLFLDSWYQHVF